MQITESFDTTVKMKTNRFIQQSPGLYNKINPNSAQAKLYLMHPLDYLTRTTSQQLLDPHN